MFHFCTITSPDYLPFVRTLFFSLREQDQDVTLHVLFAGNEKPPNEPGIEFYHPSELTGESTTQLIRKYEQRQDKLRWALKPVFMLHLLEKTRKIIYVDNDIFFFKPYGFLFDLLDQHSIILTPHWFPLHPFPQPEHFKNAFQIGLFNAGFLGSGPEGKKTLEWWAELCLFAMERNIPEGLFDDQRYLDLLPLVDEKMKIIRHGGCNIGSWNVHQNKRMKSGEEVLINGKDPVIFIHFNNETIKHIVNGNDGLLEPYLDKYRKAFALTGNHLESFKADATANSNLMAGMKRKLKLRTRLKNFLFRLSQKL